ncbi:hypothetical protein Cgig2_020773 [Carnegiea gigantea]|uniref:PB1-like domain-containing protein n=1 Tax=Carnegiea gigantea TaxID=171969 RepID=A0A9Q1K294_9CARY|nr:hypothetical protein Cgig2_020773 [Carnegiea gigantea]
MGICKPSPEMSAKSVLHVHHGGCFQKIPYLVYCLGEMKKVECDTDYLSVDNIKGIAIKLGYGKRRIKKIYYRKPNVPIKDSLVSIESDEEVHELIVLSKSFEYVSMYVDHNDEPQSVVSANNGNESNDGDSDCMTDDKYKEYRFEVEDEEVSQIRGEKKKMHDEMATDLEGFRAENRENWGERNGFDDIYAYYQESNDADSPASSESDDDDDDGDKGRNQKKKKAITYPRYNVISSNKGVELEVGLKFIDKEQLREAVEDYCTLKGYNIRIT